MARLLSPVPLPDWEAQVTPASPEALPGAAGLLLPHDGEPVADVRDRPDRWALLALASEALRRGVPTLAWGTGAALAGRVLGARVPPGGPAGEWTETPRGAVVHVWEGEVPLHWTHGSLTAWAGPTLPPDYRAAFLAELEKTAPRLPATPLEAVGGEAALRPLLADFYARARADELLGPIFAAHVRDWDAHLERVTAFWMTMLGGSPAWRGNLNHVHAGLGIRGPQLERWLALFADSARAHLPPEAADLLLARAGVMGARLGNRSRPGRVG
ncbi:group III truncated hemoglobin [Deinococcus sp. MIMF12]|uniref:Group III truncated hemoglobin n=1 Tax=Deinococcus rhizophilus TaxID=3049544 RepID=A0ABT7JJV5_9DEIO|nr:group III truncated hemoglobin [Deinococcus rhizophilus]MDL2344765.1 group III truncated hemoglobin [Deinococcus rhizophilus]